MNKAIQIVLAIVFFSASVPGAFAYSFSGDSVALENCSEDTSRTRPASVIAAEEILPFLDDIPNESDELIRDRLT